MVAGVLHGNSRVVRRVSPGRINTVGPKGLKMGHLGYFDILCIFLHKTWHMNWRCVPDCFDIKTDTESSLMTSQIMTSQISLM